MEPSNAWDRAQQAIARASQRNATVVTPDNAESPFDASETQMIPQRGLQGYDRATADRRGHGRGSPSAGPRHPGDGSRRDPGRGGRADRGGPSEPETTPVEVSDPTLMRPLREQPTVRTAATRPRTAPFPAQTGGTPGGTPGGGSAGGGRDEVDDTPTTPPAGVRVPWWKRVLGR